MKRLLALLFVLWAAPAWATTYYVRTDGNNANAGTANTAGGAWLTIDYAADHVSAGDAIRVAAGLYAETITPAVNGTSGNTVTLVADGAVTACHMTFAGNSYIRVVGFTFDPTASGCGGASNVIVGTGTNTGLEFWNVTVNHGIYGILFDRNDRCNACIVMGGTIQNISGGYTGLVLTGNDWFAGYMAFDSIDYLALGPSGNRARMMNLKFSNMVQAGERHPDFIYVQGLSTLGFSNSLIESAYGIGTPTSADNKAYHMQNEIATVWTDNVYRRNVWYNLGSGVHSAYCTGTCTGTGVLRTRSYHNTLANCNRANDSAVHNNCGNYSTGTSLWVNNDLFAKAWADASVGYVVVLNGAVTWDYNLGYSSLGTVTFAAEWTDQAHDQSNVNPQFNGATDFTLGASSGAIGNGGPLTTATSCSGTTLNVATNGGAFFFGSNATNLPQYGGALVPGDTITIGASTTRRVVSVTADALTLDSALTCSNGDAVYFGSDTTPDIGAYPYRAGGYALSATYDITGGTATITPNDASLVRFVVCYDSGVPTTVDNASPYTCSVGSGTFSARVYPVYASTTLSALATAGATPNAPTNVRIR